MSRPTEITKKLKSADTELSEYVKELERENLKLHKQIAKLQVENVSKGNQIKALKQARPTIQVITPLSDPLEDAIDVEM